MNKSAVEPQEGDKLRAVPVPSDLTAAHPEARRLNAYFKGEHVFRSKADRLQSCRNMVDVVVTKELSRRAVLIANALLKELTRRGYYNQSNPACAHIGGIEIPYKIDEPYKIKRLPPGGMWREEYHATGILRLRIRLRSRVCDGRKLSWTDTKKHRLEDCLAEFILEMEELSVAEIADNLMVKREREEERRREAERERRYLEELAVFEQEEEKRAELVTDSNNWKQSQTIREYAEAVREHYTSTPEGITNDIEDWLRWAEEQADRMDPLRKSLASVLNGKRPELEDF